MLTTLTFVAGMLVGWFTTKPQWVDNLVKKATEKVTGLFKKK